MDLIVRPDREPGPALPNHPGESDRYDPRVAQDHTGLKFGAKPRLGYKSGDPLTDCTVLMTKPAFLACPACGGKEFRVIADDSAEASSGLIQLLCAGRRCRNLWPILQLHQPQVNDILARKLGLILPEPGLKIETLLGDDDD